jgi:hypothetical protein
MHVFISTAVAVALSSHHTLIQSLLLWNRSLDGEKNFGSKSFALVVQNQTASAMTEAHHLMRKTLYGLRDLGSRADNSIKYLQNQSGQKQSLHHWCLGWPIWVQVSGLCVHGHVPYRNMLRLCVFCDLFVHVFWHMFICLKYHILQ